ncbi:p53 and DNA damage-regulated protein 1-like isoform X1 [Diadema setosum]|uniref:p53 and DNA damage-regulated protein 1-like isoform X1 n=1 Tax=Diadema setosum TaxID=31175 RepID=UPI003B3BD4B0
MYASEMPRDTNFILTHLGELEALAEEILTEKQQVVDLDRKRNQSREAVRALRRQSDTQQSSKSHSENKTWICFGNTFVKLPSKNVQTMLTEDQKRLDGEINNLREGLKPKVAKLRDMEGKAEKKGFDLKAMSREEMTALHHPGIALK